MRVVTWLKMTMRNRYLLMVACLMPLAAWALDGATLVEHWTRDPSYILNVLILLIGFATSLIRRRPVYAFASAALVIVLWKGPVLVMNLGRYLS